jgi:hypothetical protein
MLSTIHKRPQIDLNRTSIIGLINGGTAGLIWMFVVAWTGFLAVNTSMAEMASMYVHHYTGVNFLTFSGHQRVAGSIIGLASSHPASIKSL